MAEVVRSSFTQSGSLFDDGSDLTDFGDSEEAPPSTSEGRLHTQSPQASLINSSITRVSRTVTYRSKRRIPKQTLQRPSTPTSSDEEESRGRVTKQTRRDEPDPPMSRKAKRRKVENPLTPTATSSQISFSIEPVPSKYADAFSEKDVVWVKVDLQGDVVQSEEEGNDASYWWPAQVVEDDLVETTIELFGRPKYSAQPRIKLTPTSSTLLSFRCDNQLRFDESVFSNTSHENLEGAALLPEFIRKWKVALNQAVQAEKEEVLPDASSLIYEVPPSQKETQHEKELSVSRDSSEPQVKNSPPPIEPPDESVKIGDEDGELVLASDRRSRLDHWPARVVGRSFDQRTRKWLYEVRYLDNGRQKLERSRFFTCMDPGFATCRLGKWKIISPPSNNDSDNDDGDDEDEDEGDVNPNSGVDDPLSSLSDPDLDDIQDTDDFFDRSLPYQMRYVYPILCRVIRREYPPGIKLHDAFIKGRKARQELVQIAANYGQFTENEVKKIANLLRKAMLGDERRGERVVEDEIEGHRLEEGNSSKDTGDKSSAMSTTKLLSGKTSRPRGCEEYEDLSRSDRGLYSTDVLLHIAILQLHLFRSGERLSWKMQSEERENALYSKGLDLMAVRHDNHWMNDILAMRQVAENLHNKKKMRRIIAESKHSKASNTEGNRIAETEQTATVETMSTGVKSSPITRSRRKPYAKE